MTAKELHDLYKPVFDIIGSPNDGELELYFDGFEFFWIDRELVRISKLKNPSVLVLNSLNHGEPIPLHLVACACRVAVQDFIRQKYRLRINETVPNQTDLAEWVVLNDPSGPSTDHDIIRTGPTLDHALVAAALAVGEGKK